MHMHSILLCFTGEFVYVAIIIYCLSEWLHLRVILTWDLRYQDVYILVTARSLYFIPWYIWFLLILI